MEIRVFFYADIKGLISSPDVVLGDLELTVAKGVEFGLSKSADGLGNDYFRIFSKASDVNGNYPENFYALVSNTTGNTFADGNYNTLTVKKFDWTFKQTSKDVKFTKVDQVNFVPNFDKNWILEGQWITGKGSDPSEGVGQIASKPVCQYGAVNLERFAQGPGPNYTMYGDFGALHFPCNIKANERTYQGIVAYNTTNKFFYAINPDTGRIQVCSRIPGLYENATSLAKLTRNCVFASKSALRLQANEYYSGVGVLAVGRSNLTVVNIKTKGEDFELRQVVIQFSVSTDLPTFDTQTYFYSIHYQTIYRIKKTIPKTEFISAAFFTVPGQVDKEELVLEGEEGDKPSSENDCVRSQDAPMKEEDEDTPVIF